MADKTDTEIFKMITEANVPNHRLIYNITYLLSKVDDIESLVCSLSVSTDSTFWKIKVNNRIWSVKIMAISWSGKCFTYVWSLNSEKTWKENNNFNNLILDIRMQHAARLITTTEKHINSISDEVGYVSTSYFIRNFKSYFGITPKQFSLKVKRKS